MHGRIWGTQVDTPSCFLKWDTDVEMILCFSPYHRAPTPPVIFGRAEDDFIVLRARRDSNCEVWLGTARANGAGHQERQAGIPGKPYI